VNRDPVGGGPARSFRESVKPFLHHDPNDLIEAFTRWHRNSLARQRVDSPTAIPGKEEDMASESHTTTDHDEIRNWVDEHGGKPVSVRGTGNGDSTGVLRIDFPGGADDDDLEEIGWDQWFDTFDKNDLAFLYQARKSDGEDSTFFKLVSR
jgi:hypothetical protein